MSASLIWNRKVIVWFAAVLATLMLYGLARDSLDRLLAPGGSTLGSFVILPLAQLYLARVAPELSWKLVFVMNYLVGGCLIASEFLALEFGFAEPAGKVFEGMFYDRVLFCLLELVGWIPVAFVLTAVNRLVLRLEAVKKSLR